MKRGVRIVKREKKDKKNSGSVFFKGLYGDIYLLGAVYIRGIKALGRGVYSVTVKPLKHFVLWLISVFISLGRFFKRYGKAVLREGRQLFGEIKRALPVIGEAFKEKKGRGIKTFFHYVSKAFKNHERFNRAVLSTVIPVIAVIFLISLGGTLRSLTFAVSVYIYGSEVGTVSDESVYKEAEKEAKRRFETVGSDIDIAAPQYKITLTTVNGLDDKEALCNNIIDAVSDKTINACGIYVNDEFLCAVNSEDTYERVTERVLGEYAVENSYITDDYKVEFNDSITTVTGLYPENEKVWSYDELYNYMTGWKTEKTEHKTAENEKLEDILKKYNITEEELLKLNPNLDTDNIPEGSTLLIKQGEKNLSIKCTVTYLKVETIPFTTVKQYDNNLYIGTTMTVVEGSQGQDVVSYTDTYVDGVLTDSQTEVVRYNAKSPVNELLKIGTKGVPVGNSNIPVSPRLYRDQGGTFIWPAPDNCFWLSQGYNPSNGHYGIDIVSSDSGSCKGRRIVAVADGIVTMATYHYSWGYYIRVDHGSGVVTGYAHALEGSFRVNAGDYVKAGQQLSSIGTTGNSTGYHLHFEVWLDGVRVNPLPYVYSSTYGVAVD